MIEQKKLKWGAPPDDSRGLLFWVLWNVLEPVGNLPLDNNLVRILVPGGGLGGDPGWEMEPIINQNGEIEAYHLWANPEMSGIEPDTVVYSSDVVYKAIKESLILLAETHPEKLKEVEEVIKRYKL